MTTTADSVEHPETPPKTKFSPERFTHAFRNHPAGVAVITADSPQGPVGMTATSVVSVSVEPPTLIFSLSGRSSATPSIRLAETLVVHLLADTDVRIAQLCATSGSDRFADENMWYPLRTGEPVFDGVASWLRCRIVDQMEVGGSTVIAAEAIESPDMPELAVAPLVYHNRRWHRLDEHSVVA